MRARRREGGFTLIEMLVSMMIFSIVMLGIMGLLVQSSKINRTQQHGAATFSDPASCLALIAQKLRNAGWDPTNAGIQVVRFDSVPSDGIEEIEVFADLDGDGATTGIDEQVLIRFLGDRIEWRRSVAGPFEIMAVGITNDEDGDSTPELMFTPDSFTSPTRIEVRITAEAAAPDAITGAPIRHTLATEVALRKLL